MNNTLLYAGIMLISVLVSSFSQILLKKSSGKKYENKLKEYLNPPIIFAYILFFSTTLLNIFALRYVPLSLAPIIESTGYIFVSVLSFFILKERISLKKMLGMAIIMAGVIVFSIK